MGITFNPFTGQLDFLGIDQTAADARYSRLAATNVFSASGAASTPALAITGSLFTGGTTTTTKPLLLIEPTGTVSSNWNPDGTLLGGNQASSTADLINFQVDGVDCFKVTSAGVTSLGIVSNYSNTVLTLRNAYNTLAMGINSGGFLDISSSAGMLLGQNATLRFGYTGGSDPILTGNSSILSLSQATFDAPAYKVNGAPGIDYSGALSGITNITITSGLITSYS